jgi:hypothetical protein
LGRRSSGVLVADVGRVDGVDEGSDGRNADGKIVGRREGRDVNVLLNEVSIERGK